MFTFFPKDVHAHDASKSPPRPAWRIAMLDCVQRKFGKDLMPRELRAFCHLCPLDAPAVTKLCKLSKDDLVQWGKKCSEAADEWCSFFYGSDTEEASNPTEFSTQAKSRDIGCAITKRSSKICRATRILPLALSQQYSFGEVLEMFWGKKRKDRIFNLVSNIPRKTSFPSETSINSTCNLILLSDPQTCWIRGDFILEPVDHDGIFNSCELNARVRWVPRHSFQPWSTRTNADPAIFGLLKNNRENKLYNHEADLPMKDDDVITFKTDHPISMPLPDRDLLELHGFMMQVLHLAGRMPWDYKRKNCVSSVINGRMAEQDHDLGSTLEAELEFDAGVSVHPGSGTSSFPLNPSAGSIHLRKWQLVSTARGIWLRMRWFLRTRILRSQGKALPSRAARG